MIVLADGIYARRKGDTKVTDQKCRIGYHHNAFGQPSANLAFADGHAEAITTAKFSRSYRTGADNKEAQTLAIPRVENTGAGPTLCADPEPSLATDTTGAARYALRA